MTSVKIEKGLNFLKSDRLLNSSEFAAVFDAAVYKISHPAFLILAIQNEQPSPRLGLIVAKKNVRLATHRNRVKRLVRESFRLKQHNLPPIDAIVLARRGCDPLSNADIFYCLDKLWKRVAKKVSEEKD